MDFQDPVIIQTPTLPDTMNSWNDEYIVLCVSAAYSTVRGCVNWMLHPGVCISRHSLCAATEIPLMPLRTASFTFTWKYQHSSLRLIYLWSLYRCSSLFRRFEQYCIRVPPSSSFAHKGFCDTCSLISRQARWLDCNPEWVKSSLNAHKHQFEQKTPGSFNSSETKLMWNLETNMHGLNKKLHSNIHSNTDIIHLWSSGVCLYPSVRWVETQPSDCWTAEPRQQQMISSEEMETDAR